MNNLLFTEDRKALVAAGVQKRQNKVFADICFAAANTHGHFRVRFLSVCFWVSVSAFCVFMTLRQHAREAAWGQT